MCLLTSNLRRVSDPENVALDAGEAGLSKASVLQPTQLLTVDQSLLTDYIGILGAARIQQFLNGLAAVTEPREDIEKDDGDLTDDFLE